MYNNLIYEQFSESKTTKRLDHFKLNINEDENLVTAPQKTLFNQRPYVGISTVSQGLDIANKYK